MSFRRFFLHRDRSLSKSPKWNTVAERSLLQRPWEWRTPESCYLWQRYLPLTCSWSLCPTLSRHFVCRSPSSWPPFPFCVARDRLQTQTHTELKSILELVHLSCDNLSWSVSVQSTAVCDLDGRGERAGPRRRRCPRDTRHGRPRRRGLPALTGERWLGLASWPTPGTAWRLQSGIYDTGGVGGGH